MSATWLGPRLPEMLSTALLLTVMPLLRFMRSPSTKTVLLVMLFSMPTVSPLPLFKPDSSARVPPPPPKL